LMMGAPGSGKSLLAKCLPSILPEMTLVESLEVSRIHGARGGASHTPLLMSNRPFRSPHHSLSIAGLVGDRHLRPGELCLAHRGVLFLDEANEFPRHLLECLRQPLQDNTLQLTRAAGTVTYPCAFSLILAANPCPCGWYGTATRCVCSSKAQIRYLQKLSGPMLDRIDLRIWMDAPIAIPPRDSPSPEPSKAVLERVDRAVATQRDRGQVARNAQTRAEHILDPLSNHEAHEALEQQVKRSAASFRGRDSMIRVARTLADLEGEPEMGARHIHQAAELRGAPFMR
jgi:magnesium chelatase family protein